MTKVSSFEGALLMALSWCLCGCASANTDLPAKLRDTGSQALVTERLTTVLKAALGRQQISLGPDDLRTSTQISVLPPPLSPYETRSTNLPEIFDIKLRGDGCFLVRRSTGQAYALTGLTCVAVKP